MAKTKILTGLFKRKWVDEASRFYAMDSNDPRQNAFITEMDDDSDDASSIESFSTMATIDNNPGAGHVLDTYFFQPAGRQVERLAMKLSIRYLHPSRISVFIKETMVWCVTLSCKYTLREALVQFKQDLSVLSPTDS